MVWVKSELAEELAVLAAWLNVLIPWSVSVSIGEIAGGSLVEFHFPFFLVRWLFGIDVPGANPLVLFPWEAVAFYSDAPGPIPFAIWTVGAVVLAVAFLLSLGMYFAEDRIKQVSLDPVRVMGVLLLVAAILHTVASAFLQFGALPVESIAADKFPGVLIPVGVVFQFAFAYVLLRVERVDESGDDVEPGPGHPDGSA